MRGPLFYNCKIVKYCLLKSWVNIFICIFKVYTFSSNLSRQAHKFVSSVTGAGGSHCCCSCRNILGSIDPSKVAGHPYFRHHSVAFPCEFHRHDAESFWKLVDEVAAQQGTLGVTAWKQMQTDTGVVWNPHGIAMDPYLRPMFCPATDCFWDGQHCLVAASGASQYHLNGFGNAYLENGGELKHLDDFQRSIIWPPGKNRRLKKEYFQRSVVLKPAAHVKSFASDVLTGVLACLWFCKVVLMPKKIMEEHCLCLEVLQLVHDILFHMGDNAAKLADLLQSALVIHHKLFLKLYGADAAKPKFHLVYPIVDCLLRFGFSLNCFKPERMHREPKKLEQHCEKLLTLPGEGTHSGVASLMKFTFLIWSAQSMLY